MRRRDESERERVVWSAGRVIWVLVVEVVAVDEMW
jgi:hypothetical protein